MQRTARLHRIRQLLMQHAVRSQNELMQLLHDDNIMVTQATLSRDLYDLGAVKERTETGSFTYVLRSGHAEPLPSNDAQAQRFERVVVELVSSVACAQHTAVIHTAPGAAQLVASVFDAQMIDTVLGTVAGDDTIIVVCMTASAAQEVADWVLSIADGKDDGDTKSE